jgi:alanine racemase
MSVDHPHWIEISRSALLANLGTYRRILGPKIKIMSVVKANAYGHGLDLVAPIVAPHSDFLMVNTMEEALKIKNLKLKNKVFIAAPISPADFPLAAKNHISLCVHSLEYLRQLTTYHLQLTTHLKINTGTNRLGLEPSQVPAALEIIRPSKLIVEGLYTHFHSSDSGSPATSAQFTAFSQSVNQVKSVYPQALAHSSSSSASLLLPSTRLDMIRLGISLYGLWPDPYVQEHAPRIRLRPVLTWKCRPVQIRSISPGETIGYSATYTFKKPGVMAVLPIGYSDGFDRKLSNRGRMWAAGNYYPVIGRVAMNFTMIHISDTNLKRVQAFESEHRRPDAGKRQAAREAQSQMLNAQSTIELIGPHVTADDIAAKIGTINYEVVSRLNPLTPRLIVK